MTYDMQYNINSQITTINDVEAFFQHLVSERSLSFHPDDRFEDYISCDDGSNIFSEKECAIYNRLMDECFEVCEKNGANIYAIGLAFMQKASAQQKNVPLTN